jgi:hypothetical protein
METVAILLVDKILKLLYGLGFPVITTSHDFFAVVNSDDSVGSVYEKVAGKERYRQCSIRGHEKLTLLDEQTQCSSLQLH